MQWAPMRPRRRRGSTLARPVESSVSVQPGAAQAVDARYFSICARPRLVLPGASCVGMATEAVLYTTVAAVHRHRQDHLPTEPDALAVPAAVLEAARGRRILPPCTWQPVSCGAWAQVHICVEIDAQTAEARFRIVVWLLESGAIVVNDILGVGCHWWRSVCDDAAFRRLSGVDCHTYGFHFRSAAKAAECSRIVSHILANVPGVLKVVKKLMRANVDLQGLVMAWQGFGLHSIHYLARVPRIYSETTPSSSSSPRVYDLSPNRTIYPKEQEASSPSREDQDLYTYEQQDEGRPRARQTFTDYDRAVAEDLRTRRTTAHNNQVEEEEEFGRMATSPVALLETAGGVDRCPPERTHSRGERISRPYKTRGETHVTYNAEFARFEGLPDEWRELNQQFGLPLEAVLKREVEGYDSKLPAVLVMLKTCFLAHNGARTEGVFRLAPDKREYSAVKRSIDDGTFTDCSDVHIMASLIKVWFRELPVSLFSMLPENQIARTCELVDPEPKVVLESLAALPALHQAVLFWLLDLLNEIVKYERENKMTAKSMAIVMAPNLLSAKNTDAAVAVAAYRQVADFVQALLRARQAVR